MNRERTLRPLLTTRTLVAAFAAVVGLAFAGTASAQRYVVLYDHVAPPGLTEVQVSRAGGSVVATYHRIGVVIAESSAPDFEAAIERFRQVEGAVATASYAVPAGIEPAADETRPSGSVRDEPAADEDTFSGLQWGLDQIRAKEAHAVTGGSPEVLVGHIDTGIDASHPDLAPNLDLARSVSCVGGAPNTDLAAWGDDSGHGTNTAGIIVAADNGIGTVGVAPNVRIAAIKASVRDGMRDVFLPEAVICAFHWAATHGIDVTNNSYSVDSALVGGTTSFCHTDPNQRVVIEAVQRSIHFAMLRGASVVASAGNSNADMLADPCVRLPSELPGVTTVAATGILGARTAYSNFGLGVVDLAAPGGEVTQGGPPPGNLILSTWPAKFPAPTLLCDPLGTPCFPGPTPGVSYYRYGLGTSQAAAHVSGVAALVVGRLDQAKRFPFFNPARPWRVAAILRKTADPQPCPADPRCVAEGDVNGFYGHGIVDALSAVTLLENRDRD